MFEITKKLYLKAPCDGVAVYAQHQCYVATDGAEMIESVRCEARNEKRKELGGASYYSKEIYRRVSENNGKDWKVLGDVYHEDPLDKTEEHPFTPQHYFDSDNGLLVTMFLTKKYDVDKRDESFSDEGITHKKRMYYQISSDMGKSWSEPKVMRQKGADYNDINWGPSLFYGKNGGAADLSKAFKHNDTIIFPMIVNLEDGKRYQSVILRGKWNEDNTDILWDFGDYVSVSPTQSSQGCCEPMPVLLDDGTIFMSLRCCGDRKNKTFPSLKFWVSSNDDGKTFSKPQPLTYEDGSMVWSPSSYAGIIRSSKNKRYYFIGNILDKPTYDSGPRYPLCIAELVPQKGVVVKDSVAVIDTKGDDCKEPRRRYTNFGFYEDRFSGEIILTLPEQPKTSWADFTADCYQYRIKIQDKKNEI
jgi:hypothetical protein